MLTPRWRPEALLLGLLPATACQAPQREVLIGLPVSRTYADIAAVAQDELDERRAPGAVAIRVVYDTSSMGDRAELEVARAQRFAEDPRIVGIAGHGGSRGSLVASAVYNEREVPQVVPTGTSRLLRHAGRWTFMLAPDDSTEGEFIARYLTETLGAGRVVVFYDNDEYGIGLRDGVQAGLRRQGAAVVDAVPIAGHADIESLALAALRRNHPDAIVAASRQAGTGALAQVARRARPGVPVVAGDGALVLPHIRDMAGPALPLLTIVAFWVPERPDSVSRAFVERWRRVVGREPNGPEAMYHDAIMVLAEAVREVGPKRRNVRRYLEDLGEGLPPYRGVTGPISFGTQRRVGLHLVRVDSARVVPVALP